MKTINDECLVTLVDRHGKPTGFAEKIEAHQRGDLHLAFSLMIVRKHENKIEYLLQQRAKDKYHSGGLWANTCCSHPLPGESIESAAHRRVYEELGIKGLPAMLNIGQIYYKHKLDNNMIEHEYDNIVITEVDYVSLQPNPNEVMALQWWQEDEIEHCLSQNASIFAAWFPQVFNFIKNHELALSTPT